MFFSSPFGGLELEREELTKKYWPQLQSLCSRHGYTFIPVDLRWGITSDLSANASTIMICLSEIDRSDIFVGFFGQVLHRLGCICLVALYYIVLTLVKP